jgi:UDP-N-acetylmuramoyl-L-alanyl-D-glutamate--2,6-diaminopimelate ligase
MVLEVTSEGIKQHRHRFINFTAAIFTNLTPEHIESHGGFEKYKAAKGKLFKTCKNIHIINIEDENANYFLQFKANKKYTYGLNKGDINNKDIRLNLKLPGEFNIYNALAAISLAISQGIKLEIAKKAVEKIENIAGRMEEVISYPFKVIVDYAVTPDALEKAYQTIKNMYSVSKTICVFGSCGGGRDKWKRPTLGKIAAKYCDNIILTNEDPYDEDPLKIIEDIEKGIVESENFKSKKVEYEKILDRKEAIKKSLEIAKNNDIVIITGKGCEPWMCLENNKKIPWNEREIIKEEFRKVYGKV